MKNLFLFLLMAGMTTMISCKGEQGDPGPAGVAGSKGADGTDGANGTNGTDGNANVKSWTADILTADWIANGPYENNLQLSVPIVTQAIADNGLVMVYIKTYALGLDGTTWTALPFSLAYSSYTEAFSFSVASGIVKLKETSNDGAPIEPSGTIRVVAATANGLARNPDLDWTNYEEVKVALNLAD